MNKSRPVNLRLTTVRFPSTAIVSILHRITGVLLFLSIPLLLCLLDSSLRSSDGFNSAKAFMSSGIASFFIWVILSAIMYHLVAGIRHLLMDFGFGESKEGGKRGAWVAMVVSIILILLLGWWLW